MHKSHKTKLKPGWKQNYYCIFCGAEEGWPGANKQCPANIPDAPKDTSSGMLGPNLSPEPTNKSDAPSADSGQSGLDERQKVADMLGVPIEQVHRLEWKP